MFSRFTINTTKLVAVCAIIETVLIFYLSEAFGQTVERHIDEELRQKFHKEYLSLIFENSDADK